MYNNLFQSQLVREMVGGEEYSYYPLGDHIVRAPGVCGGRPTFKYTRIEVSFILNRIAKGKAIDYLVDAYNDSNLTHAAILEAMSLANTAFMNQPLVVEPLAA